MEAKKYINVHVSEGFSVKSKFKTKVTLEYAREYGKKEEVGRPYLQYLGVFGVDITQKEINQLQKRMENDEFTQY